MFEPQPAYNDRVFINCPFDQDYMPLLYAIVYTIYRCGFVPECALSEDDGTDFRLEKIYRCIEKCRYGIHDISRIELNNKKLPRFNMPFELGIFFGAKRFGNTLQKNKNALVLEKTKYRYQQYISDLSGIDSKSHNNQPNIVIDKVRDCLKTASRRSTLPGSALIKREYKIFRRHLPEIIVGVGLNPKAITFNEYCEIVETSIIQQLNNASV